MSDVSARLSNSSASGPLVARIDELDGEGHGWTRINGTPVRVDGALEGELVNIEIVKRRRRFTDARLTDVLEPSPHRVQPSCQYFSVCGGCRLQHLSLDAQRAKKQGVLEQALAAHGVAAPREWFPPIAALERGYRRKARLSVKYVAGKGGALVGFREKRGSYIADVQQCEVLVPSVGERISALRELITGLHARDRIPQIEVAAGDDTTALVLRHLDPLTAADLNVLRDFARRHQLRLYLQSAGLASIVPLWPENPPPLRYRLPEFELELEFQPADFVQVNAAVNRALVSRAVDWLDPGPGDRVLDLFCGIGNFSLALARRGAWVLGVEASDNMVAAAAGNARTNGIASASFEVADLEEPEAVKRVLAGGYSGMLLDPPRSGAASVLAQLIPPFPSAVVYVSCSPESFARDAAVLVRRHGYRLDRAGTVDLFPHTRHVEVIGRFLGGRR